MLMWTVNSLNVVSVLSRKSQQNNVKTDEARLRRADKVIEKKQAQVGETVKHKETKL
jgi:hypothetical protein